jgi:hypothetical protein
VDGAGEVVERGLQELHCRGSSTDCSADGLGEFGGVIESDDGDLGWPASHEMTSIPAMCVTCAWYSRICSRVGQ